jgi:hypothetical protein
MRDVCIREGLHTAAELLAAYVTVLDTCRIEIEAWHKRLQPLLQAVEWWRSGDWGRESVEEALVQMHGSPAGGERDQPVGGERNRPGSRSAPDCGLNDDCRRLEEAAAEANALVLFHEKRITKLEAALDAMAHYFLPEVHRGPDDDGWLEAVGLFLAVRPQHELSEDLHFYVDG